MKKLLSGLIMLGALLSLFSCSKVVYTHNQVMASYRTKDAVLRQFGPPDEKREVNGITEWLYNCDNLSAFTVSKTKVAVNGTYNGISDTLNARSVKVTQFTNFSQYIKFTFNKKGTVSKWDSQGVNFRKKKIDPEKTILLVLGITGLFLLLPSDMGY